MEASFWHRKWERGEIGFHQSHANPFLVTHFEKLSLEKKDRVFLPLCGKTLDISWLLTSGYRVAGSELSELAINDLFDSLGLQPTIIKVGALIHYSAQDIDIYVGDIFDLSTQILGPVDAIYDRAALVALPDEIRKKYTTHLISICKVKPQLIITFEYDQLLVDGPPFSVGEEELQQHYGATYELIALDTKNVEGGIRGQAAASERVWLLKKTTQS